jgi:hypothetical protein
MKDVNIIFFRNNFSHTGVFHFQNNQRNVLILCFDLGKKSSIPQRIYLKKI